MKVHIVSGSRNPEGQTARAVEAFRAGVREAGGDAEVSWLPLLRIERCRQCNADGWGLCRSEGRCVIEDDFEGVLSAMEASGGVAFATPVYYSDLSESLRAFLDRLRRVSWSRRVAAAIKGKPAVGLCVAGGGGGGAPACIVQLERILNTCGFDVQDLVPVRRQNLEHKIDVLRATGHWFSGRA